MEQDLREIAFDIALGLLEDAIINNDQVNWLRIIDSPPTDWMGRWLQNYYGYNWGTAGIADTLLKFYSSFNIQSFLSYTEKSANYLLEEAQNFTGGGLFWYTAEGLKTQYSGIKYGNAGIASFFLHLYEETSNETYLQALENAIKPFEIKAMEANMSELTHWGFTFSPGEAVSDIIYGTAGIAGVLLEAGLSLNRTSWINLASNSGKWLENISVMEPDTDTMAIPWSVPSFSDNDFYTGYSAGNAGVGSFFIKLYRGTGEMRWLDNAKKVGNWLISNKTDGTWINGGVSYTTDDLNENATITGIDSGAAGIGQFFLELFAETQDVKYAHAVFDAASWLISHANSSEEGVKWPKTTSGIDDNDSYFTGYSFGAAGIGSFFGQAYEVFGCSQFKTAMLGAARWLNSTRTERNRFPVATGNTRYIFNDPYQNQYGHHLSYYDGAAGIALFFLNAADAYSSTTLYPTIASCDQLPSFGQSSVPIDDLSEGILLAFLGFLSVSLIILIVILTSKKKAG
ncbi:MAG: lanthionine synthetase LanC family protein [Candidatus Hodarchaeales archaeon]